MILDTYNHCSLLTFPSRWLTYVASVSLLETAQGGPGHLLISILVVARLVPYTLFSFAGGILADTRDRKQVMLVLDLLGSVVALGYLNARSSTAILYLCAILQSSISGLYEPSRSASLPLLVGPEYLEKANEVACIAWSLSAAAGSSLGGFVMGHYGASACFLTDSILYLLSACILAVKVRGDFSVAGKEEKRQGRLVGEVIDFLWSSDSSPFLLIKGCGALLFGASDVINVTFSQVEGVMDSQRLGWMFSAVGVGCLLGPLVMPEGRSYLTACIVSYFVLGLGYGLIGWSDEFWLKCLWTVLRSAGTAVLWVDSSILLQTTTPSTLLGRISAIDFALATLGEAASALIAGLLQDLGMSANQVAFVLSGMGFSLAALWAGLLYCRRRLRLNKDEIAPVELESLPESIVD
jgi:MFS family permease